jgi:CHAD domain-containing protein
MNPDEIVARLESFVPGELARLRRQVRGAGRKNPDEPVHEARKSIKKLRAALRLARKMAPRRALDDVENPLREAAHALGPLRDHLVLNETVHGLARRGEKTPPGPAAPDARPLLKLARDRMRAMTSGWRRLSRAGFDSKGVEPGLERIYRRAKSKMERARKNAGDEALHAWRRRAKDLLYVLEMIAAPRRVVKELDKLTNLLGKDHDLATFIAHHSSTAGKITHSGLVRRARKKRAPLQKEAFRLGKQLFKEDAGKFARRVMD